MKTRWELAREAAKRSLASRRDIATAVLAGAIGFGVSLVIDHDGVRAALIGLGAVVAAFFLVPGVTFVVAAATATGKLLRAEVAALTEKIESVGVAAGSPGPSPSPLPPLAGLLLPVIGDLEAGLRLINELRAASGWYVAGVYFEVKNWEAVHQRVAGYPNIDETYSATADAVAQMKRVNAVRQARLLNAQPDRSSHPDKVEDTEKAIGRALTLLRSKGS